MKLLLDTHLLLWTAAGQVEKLSPVARSFIDDPANELFFSAASIWEIAIKCSLQRDDFLADPHVLRRGLLDNGYIELVITSAHAASVDSLPLLHKDPFDRILIAQSTLEGITLLTVDTLVSQYHGSIRLV